MACQHHEMNACKDTKINSCLLVGMYANELFVGMHIRCVTTRKFHDYEA